MGSYLNLNMHTASLMHKEVGANDAAPLISHAKLLSHTTYVMLPKKKPLAALSNDLANCFDCMIENCHNLSC